MSIPEKDLLISGKLERGKELTESEICYFMDVMGKFVSEETGERHRWTEEVHTVTRFNGKLYAVDWERGLTENNYNEYPNQPYKVPNSDIPKTTLYLYALTQEENLSGLGHFDACIVCAQSEDEAKLIHPDGRLIWDYEDVALCCYEKPGAFCHRHLVTDWLDANGFKCAEWEPQGSFVTMRQEMLWV